MITSEDLRLARSVHGQRLASPVVVQRLLAQLDSLPEAPGLGAWLVARGHVDAEQTRRLSLEARLSVARSLDDVYARLLVEGGLDPAAVRAHLLHVGPNAKRLGFRLVAAGLVDEPQDQALMVRARDTFLAEEAAVLEGERARGFDLDAREPSSPGSADADPARPAPPSAPAETAEKPSTAGATVLDLRILPLPPRPATKSSPGDTVRDTAVLPLPPPPKRPAATRSSTGQIATAFVEQILERASQLLPKSGAGEPTLNYPGGGAQAPGMTIQDDTVLPLPTEPARAAQAPAPTPTGEPVTSNANDETAKHREVLALPPPSAVGPRRDAPLRSSYESFEADPAPVSAEPASSGENEAAVPLPQPGDTIDSWRVESEVARGGMGVVYRVARVDSDSPFRYALKVVNLRALDAEGKARFRRELEALGRASGHPSVVRVVSTGHQAGRPYYVMELVEGRSLQDLIRETGGLETARAVSIGLDLARALAHCHQQGIVHRDLKPANVLLREDGTPVLTDFGMSVLAGATQDRLTHTHEVLGTPLYMAPEQALGRTVDPRSDVYALGATLYAALSGSAPVPADGGTMEVLARVAKGELISLQEAAPEVPDELAAIVERALALDPEDRYPSALELARDLESFATTGRSATGGTRARARRLRRLVVSVALASVALLGLAVAFRWEARRREAHGEGELANAARLELVRRAKEAGFALYGGDGTAPEKRLATATRAYEGAAEALEKLGLSREAARRAVETSSLPTLGTKAYVARARARLERTPGDLALALADLERARAIVGAADAASPDPARHEVRRELAEALLDAGEDEKAEAELARLEDDPSAALRLAELRLVARGDPGAPDPAPSAPALERARFRLERALATRDVGEARLRLEELSRIADPRAAFEASLARLEIAVFAGARGPSLEAAREVERAVEREGTTAWDRARGALALGELALSNAGEPGAGALSPSRAASVALEAAGASRGGPVRALRARAHTLLATVQRRSGDLDAAATEAKAALADARSPRARALAALELARTAHARDDALGAREALGLAPPHAGVPGVGALERILERERRRSAGSPGLAVEAQLGALGARARLLPGPPRDVPGEVQSLERVRAAARQALGVAVAAEDLARGRWVRSPRDWLDIERTRAEAVRDARASGLGKWLSGEIAAHRVAVDEPLSQAHERTRPFAERALALARIAHDEDPEHEEPLELAVRACLVGAKAEPRLVRSLVDRLLRASGTPVTRALAARAALDLVGDAVLAETLATSLLAGPEPEAEWFALRARARIKLGKQEAKDDVAQAFQLGPADPELLEGFQASLERGDPASIVSFVHGGRLGTDATERCRLQPDARLSVRGLAGSLDHEASFAWGLEGRVRPISTAPGTEAAAIDAIAVLGSALSWSSRDDREQLLRLRGLARGRLATTAPAVTLAVLDLADAAAHDQGRTVELLLEVERRTREEAVAKEVEARLRIVRAGGDPGAPDLWSPWTDATLGLVALAAVRAKHGAMEPAQREAALELCDALLAEHPGSVAGLLVRGLLLSRAERPDEAAASLAAALAAAPDLEQETDGLRAGGFLPLITGR